ncbi:MAG: hypothetical protein IIZ27_07695 [Solobacterium sp.]|nr:hypothetical protein [Solobacterium sp.]MBR2670333.1 hypothetical protein [Solobacterium sp.]
MIKLLLNMCGIFYGVLCVFSIVTGLIYVSGKRELNPLELSDTFMEKYKDPEKRRQFAVKMGWVTFVVGIVQGMTSYAIFKRNSPAGYWFALGFTIFSICSVAVKLKGKINAFPILKCIAYTAILILLLLGETRALFLY